MCTDYTDAQFSMFSIACFWYWQVQAVVPIPLFSSPVRTNTKVLFVGLRVFVELPLCTKHALVQSGSTYQLVRAHVDYLFPTEPSNLQSKRMGTMRRNQDRRELSRGQGRT